MHTTHLLTLSSISCKGLYFKLRRQTVLEGRSVPFYRWGSVIQAHAFLSSFLNTRVFAYLFRTSATLGLQGFSGLCTSYNTLFPQYLSSLWFFTSLKKIFHDRPLNIQGMLCDHGLKCMGPVTDGGCETGWFISWRTEKAYFEVVHVDDIHVMFCEILTT